MSSEFVTDATARLVAVMRHLGISAEVAGMVAAEWSAGVVRDWAGERPYIGTDAGEVRTAMSRRDAALRADWQAGERTPALARKYGISHRRVQQIVKM